MLDSNSFQKGRKNIHVHINIKFRKWHIPPLLFFKFELFHQPRKLNAKSVSLFTANRVDGLSAKQS